MKGREKEETNQLRENTEKKDKIKRRNEQKQRHPDRREERKEKYKMERAGKEI